MVITNVHIFMPDGNFVYGNIHIRNGRISGIDTEESNTGADKCDEERLDGKGQYAIPGMIDMHFHGCGGYDVCDGTEEALDEIAKYELSIGVTTIAPATMTLPVRELCHILQTLDAYRKGQDAKGRITDRARLAGINMEGPFISKEKRGAQDESNILPCDTGIFREFMEASGGLVKIMGIAPENGESDAFIKEASKSAVISLAHSNADYETAKRAIAAGASHVVHLFNAMPPLNHRAPGIIGAAFESEKVTAEIICDGIHIHPAAVRAAFKLFGEDRMIMISDSMRAAGLGDGRYTLGGLDVDVKGRHATMVRDGALAGSVTTLPECAKIAVNDMGLPLKGVVKAVTENPAKKLGIYERCGSLEAGKDADIVLLDKKINVTAVIKSGELANIVRK